LITNRRIHADEPAAEGDPALSLGEGSNDAGEMLTIDLVEDSYETSRPVLQSNQTYFSKTPSAKSMK
jgi:hypothetical protein